MSRNVIRRSNSIEVRKFRKIFVLIFVLTAVSFTYVFFQNRTVVLGQEIKRLETEIAEIEKRNRILSLDIERRMKPRALQAKIEEFRLDLVSISGLPKVAADVPAYRLGAQSYARRNREGEQ